MSGILDGIRVVDMSRYISGPYCAMMLADMGAEVIKVEKPGEGEIYRVGGPWKDGVSLVFQAMNRNKKSVTADTRSPEGLQLIKEALIIPISLYKIGKSRGVPHGQRYAPALFFYKEMYQFKRVTR